MDSPRRELPTRLNLWDAVSIIVGIIIGVGIFQNPKDVAEKAPDAWLAMGTWLVGGILVMFGTLCFAELASAYPRSGGEFVYLTRAYGSLVGFLFAWTQLSVIRSCSIGWLAYMVGVYLIQFFDLSQSYVFPIAIGSLLGLTIINILGVTLGKVTQNIFTVAKILAMGVVIWIGWGWGSWGNLNIAKVAFGGAHGFIHQSLAGPKPGWFIVAMVPVLWAYSGWNEAAYIVSEVKRPTKNLPRALLIGTSLVIVIYVLMNLSYLMALGIPRLADSEAAASELVNLAYPGRGKELISLIIGISALGAMNGMIITTSRLCHEFGTEHALFRHLGHWHAGLSTPLIALAFQAGLVGLMMIGVERLGKGDEKLDTMIQITGAVFWFFFLLTGFSVILLRRKNPTIDRPFKVPGYPWLPLIFCFSCGAMFLGTIVFQPKHALIGLGILLAGLPLFFISNRMKQSEPLA